MKVFYYICFVATFSAVSADINLKPTNTEQRQANHSVHVVDANVPDQQYTIDAIGVVQLVLNTWDDEGPEAVLQNIQFLYQEYHSAATWKVASNCSYLVLPYNAWYIKLEDTITGTKIILFATPLDPITTTSTSAPTTTRYPTTSTSTTTIPPTTTGSPLPFSVSIVNYKNVGTEFLLEALGLLQFYLDKEKDFNKALPEVLEYLQEYESREVWKAAGSCSYIQDYSDYVWLHESLTSTDVIIFA
ncbi:hypothetical protein ABEB36_012496 [Hypothenemus hampei]|uniref:Uncharacterized protein n=1 Tax=Hypothenemus hampei TaxID=57062 RepID=A0ABD1EC54_HYPHA